MNESWIEARNAMAAVPSWYRNLLFAVVILACITGIAFGYALGN